MRDPRTTSDRNRAVFAAGVLAFTVPVLALFNVEATVFGVPVLYLYLFGAWGALIGLMALTARRAAGDDEG